MTDFLADLKVETTEVDVPASKGAGRKPKPNPLLGLVQTANQNRGKAQQFTIKASGDAELAEMIRQVGLSLNRAGRDLKCSVRRDYTVDESKHTATFRVWCLDKREPKPKNEAKTETVADSPAATTRV